MQDIGEENMLLPLAWRIGNATHRTDLYLLYFFQIHFSLPTCSLCCTAEICQAVVCWAVDIEIWEMNSISENHVNNGGILVRENRWLQVLDTKIQYTSKQ